MARAPTPAPPRLSARADRAREDGTKSIYLSTGAGGEVDDMRAILASVEGK